MRLCQVLTAGLGIFQVRTLAAAPGLANHASWPPGVALPGVHCSTAHGILIPRPGIEPMSSALQGRFFNHWTTIREVPPSLILVLQPSLHPVVMEP